MLTILIPTTEQYNEETNEFEIRKGCILTLEHSLVSVSKWEAKYCRSFLKNDKKTSDEMIHYIRCMIIKSSVKDFELMHNDLTEDLIKQISDYISHPMTATTFSQKSGNNREIITSELIYYWMISQQIPFECQYWHLNRLLTLINVCAIKNSPPKKMGKNEILSRNAQLNAERKRMLNTTG